MHLQPASVCTAILLWLILGSRFFLQSAAVNQNFSPCFSARRLNLHPFSVVAKCVQVDFGLRELTYIPGFLLIDKSVRLLLRLDSSYRNQYHLTVPNRRRGKGDLTSLTCQTDSSAQTSVSCQILAFLWKKESQKIFTQSRQCCSAPTFRRIIIQDVQRKVPESNSPVFSHGNSAIRESS